MLSKIKQITISMAVAAVLALPMSFVQTESLAEPWYKVTGRYLEMRNRAHGEGKVICHIPKNEILYRNHEQNWSRWIHVQWTKKSEFEWHYKDYFGKWCPIWDRKGWIDKTHEVSSTHWPSWAY